MKLIQAELKNALYEYTYKPLEVTYTLVTLSEEALKWKVTQAQQKCLLYILHFNQVNLWKCI